MCWLANRAISAYPSIVARSSGNAAAWVVGGLATLGLIALASSSRNPARQSFQDELRSELSQRGLRLVTAELGLQHGLSVWVVTCETTDGRVISTNVQLPGPPYDRPQYVAGEVAGALARI